MPASGQPTQPSSPASGDDVLTEYRLPPDTLARSEALYRTSTVMLVVGTVYGLAVLVLLLVARVAPRYRDLAERASRRRVVQALVFAPLLILTLDVLSLPLSMYGHHLQLQYGLSVQGWASWFWDWVKAELIGIVIGTLLVWGLYAFLRRSPTRWWFYGWLASIPVVLLLIFIGPIFIAPLFNTFAPLQERQPALVPELEKVMARGGLAIERSRMFEMQASDKVTTYNAYVTGIGASKRVVVWDNTSRDLTIPETMFVFGHEMGHYVLQHIWLSIGLAIAGLLVQLYLASRLLGGLLARFGRALERARHRRLGVVAGAAAAPERVLADRAAGVRRGLALPGASGRHLRARGHPRPGARLVAGSPPTPSRSWARRRCRIPRPIHCWCSGPTITRRCATACASPSPIAPGTRDGRAATSTDGSARFRRAVSASPAPPAAR